MPATNDEDVAVMPQQVVGPEEPSFLSQSLPYLFGEEGAESAQKALNVFRRIRSGQPVARSIYEEELPNVSTLIPFRHVPVEERGKQIGALKPLILEGATFALPGPKGAGAAEAEMGAVMRRAAETASRAISEHGDIAQTNIGRLMDSLGKGGSLETNAARLRNASPKERQHPDDLQQIGHGVAFFRDRLLAMGRAALKQPWARAASKQYQGYHTYATKIADEFGHKPETAMLAESALSPNNSPDQSFEATRRLMKMLRDNPDDRFDAKMSDWARNATWISPEKGRLNLYSDQDIADLAGKKFSELPKNNVLQAQWLRAFDEAYHPDRTLRVVRPDGTLGDFVKTSTGKQFPFAWTPFKMMQSGIDALQGTRTADQILSSPKVANYYMSKLFAFQPSRHVVVDTHHTSAAWGNSMPASHELIRSVFPAQRVGPNAEFGGYYSIIHEATLQAADKLGMDPKEFQAMIWSYQRGFRSPDAFGKSTIGKAAVVDIQNLWKDAAKGKISEQEANKRAEQIALKHHKGKVPEPGYFGSGGEEAPLPGTSGQPAELPTGGGVRGRAGSGVGGDVTAGTAIESGTPVGYQQGGEVTGSAPWEDYAAPSNLPVTFYTPGQGDPKMEGGWETSTGAPMTTMEMEDRGAADYTTGAVGPSTRHLLGQTVTLKSPSGKTHRVGLTDYGPGVPGIDIATEKGSWGRSAPEGFKVAMGDPGEKMPWEHYSSDLKEKAPWEDYSPEKVQDPDLYPDGTARPPPGTGTVYAAGAAPATVTDQQGKVSGLHPIAGQPPQGQSWLQSAKDYLSKIHVANKEEYRQQIEEHYSLPKGPGMTEPLWVPKRLEAGQPVPNYDPATMRPTGKSHEATPFEAAVTNQVNGILSGATSVKGLMEMLPPVFLAETLYNAPTLYRQIQEVEKTPAWSQQRWEAGLTVVGTLGSLGLMGHAMVKDFMSGAPKEVADRIGGETYAQKPDPQTGAIPTQQRVAPVSQAKEQVQARDPRDTSAQEQKAPVTTVPPEHPEAPVVQELQPQSDQAKAQTLEASIGDPLAADRTQVFGPSEQVQIAAKAKAGGMEPASAQALGLTPFDPFARDLGEKIGQTARNFAKGIKQIRAIFSPANASPEAGTMAGIIRAHEGELARRHEIAAAQVKDFQKIFNRTSNTHNLDVINRMETGQAADPRYNPYRALRKQNYDQRIAEVQKLSPNALQNLIEDYFPHIWTKESVERVNQSGVPASNPWAAIFGKRPLTGPKAFLKQRTIPDTMTGVSIGLEPVTFNPVELDMLKWHEMDRYIAGQKIIAEMKDRGLTKFLPAGAKAPLGYTQINDPAARVFAPKNWKIVDEAGKQMPGIKLLGHLYAPDDVARVINNHLSPGLRGFAPYDAFRSMGNTMNQVQLGLSLYHATFTAIDSAASTGALGIEQIARSGLNPADIAKGTFNIGRSLAQAPIGGALLENLWRGSRFLKEYSKPGSTNGRMAKIVDAATQANVRVKMDKFYQTGWGDSFIKAIRNRNYGGALLRAPLMAVEMASKPLMEYVVPRLKNGINAQRIDYELSKLPVTATPDQVRTVISRVVDSTDNRMGQMTYDNVFWNKSLKDLLMASVRSVGWNLGDIRELGGGALDAIKTPMRMYKNIAAPEIGANPVMTTRMAYLMYYPIIVGSLGAMYQYLKTGEGPKSLEDYFMPRTGRMNSDGSPERVMLPTYMKDIAPLAVAATRHGVVGFTSRLGQMGINKLHPLLNSIAQMWQNKDYYGTEIRHEGDNLVQTVKKEAAFILKQFEPFSFRGFTHREGGLPEKTESIIGIMPAAKALTMSPAEELAHKYYIDLLPQGARTQEQSDLGKLKSDTLAKIRRGDYEDLKKAVSSGKMSQDAALRLAKRAQVSPLEYQVNRLSPDQAIEVWRLGDPNERTTLAPMLRAKVLRSKQLSRDKMIGYLNELSQ